MTEEDMDSVRLRVDRRFIAASFPGGYYYPGLRSGVFLQVGRPSLCFSQGKGQLKGTL